jgi:hypothetical protein
LNFRLTFLILNEVVQDCKIEQRLSRDVKEFYVQTPGSVISFLVLKNQPNDQSAKLNKNHENEKAMHLELHETKCFIVAMNQTYE